MGSRLPSRQTEPRRGTVTPLTVLNLSLLVGVVALVVDGGTLMEARRHVQAAADAAALAGAADLYSNYNANQGIDHGTASASAVATALANGFANDGVQSTVTVNTSSQKYQGGPNAGQTIPAGYIEVLIQYNASHLFSGVFGSGTTPVPARAVARARTTSSNNNALYVLNMSSRVAGALALGSGASLRVSGSIQINSSSSQALSLSGGASVMAAQFTVNPGALSLAQSLSSVLFSLGGTAPAIASGSPVADPLLGLPAPDSIQLGLSTQGTNLILAGITQDLYPGIYSGGITVKRGGTAILHANSDGTPGIYYLTGSTGLQVSGSSGITTANGETAGIMIYNNWSGSTATINLSGTGSVSLIPPASGPYRGLSIFQKRGTLSTAAPTITAAGIGNLNVTGTIYAAYAPVSLIGSAGVNVFGGQIVADTLNVTGSGIFKIDAGSQSIANQRVFGLVE